MPLTLLRPYFYALRNRAKEYSVNPAQRRSDLIIASVTLLTMVLIFICSYFMLDGERLAAIANKNPYLQGIFPAMLLTEILPVKAIQIALFVYFPLLIVSSTVSAVANFYNSHSMDLLLTTPLSSMRIYLAKLTETAIQTGLFLVVFSLPILVAYSLVVKVKIGFFLVAAFMLIPILLIPAGLAVVFATIFVNFSSFFWRRGLLLLVCGLFAGLYGFVHFLSILSGKNGRSSSLPLLLDFLGPGSNPNPIWLPSRWAADILCYFIGEPIISPLTKIALLVITTIGSCALGFLIFDRFILKVRSTAGAEHTYRREQSIDLPRAFIEVIAKLIPAEPLTRTLAVKDMTSLCRDRSQALQLLLYLGISLFYVTIFKFVSSFLNLFTEANQAWWALLSVVNVVIAGFFLVAIVTRLIYPSISLEGRAFWVLLVAPFELTTLVSAKFRYWLPLAVILSITLLLAGALAINDSLALLFTTTVIASALALGCSGVATGLGAMFASFDWESPSQVISGPGTLVLLCCNFTLVLLTAIPAAVLLPIAIIPNLRIALGPGLTFTLISSAVLFMFALHIFSASWALKKGAKALAARQGIKT